MIEGGVTGLAPVGKSNEESGAMWIELDILMHRFASAREQENLADLVGIEEGREFGREHREPQGWRTCGQHSGKIWLGYSAMILVEGSCHAGGNRTQDLLHLLHPRRFI